MKKLIIFLLLLFPIYGIGYGFYTNDLGANPIDYIIDTSGEWALGILLLTLSMTPLRNIFKLAEFSQYKRMFGLFSFFYATIHLLTYVGLDHSFNVNEITKQIINNKYILVGFVAWFLMIPLALTSNLYSIRLLKSKWKLLHKLTYAIAILAILHYIWLVKTVSWEPFIYAAITFILLLYRTKFSFRDFWYKYSHLIFILAVLSPIIILARTGGQPQLPSLKEDPKAIHNINEAYFKCYEQSVNNGESFEVRINKCNKLWKEE